MGKSKINRSLILIFLGYTCVYLDKNIISLSVIPIAQDLGINAGQKGLILSAFFLGYTLFQIPFGFLGNRLGSRKIMTFAILLIGVLMICLGFGFSLIYLLMIRFAAGSFAHAGYPSAVSAFVTKEVEPAKRGSVQSSMIASSGFAGIVGPLLVAPLLTLFGWETTYFVYGVIVLVIGFLMIRGIPKTAGEPIVSANQSNISFFEVIKDRNVWIMVLAAFFINAAVYGMTGWIASYLVDEFNLTMNRMAMMSAFIGFVMMISAMFAGSMIGRHFKDREKQVILVASALGGLVAFLLSKSHSLVLSMLFLALAVAAASIGFATLMSLPVKLFAEREVSTKYSIINAVGVSGGFFAPMIIGWLVNTSGSYGGAFSFIALVFVLAGIVSLAIQTKDSKQAIGELERQK
ncbi:MULTISPECIES: MFS transporter [Enterococcus]|uniref:MFS transporter n=1 Tax=Enterococcus TaxID=1350 RepID=UPI000EEEE9AF|nr:MULTISPECIES: MFS transporter [Enterococcus]HCM87656.1 MFS transporter [Enterococcus sp.]